MFWIFVWRKNKTSKIPKKCPKWEVDSGKGGRMVECCRWRPTTSLPPSSPQFSPVSPVNHRPAPRPQFSRLFRLFWKISERFWIIQTPWIFHENVAVGLLFGCFLMFDIWDNRYHDRYIYLSGDISIKRYFGQIYFSQWYIIKNISANNNISGNCSCVCAGQKLASDYFFQRTVIMTKT